MSGDSAVSFEAGIVLRPRRLDESFDLALAYARTYLSDFVRLSLRLLLPCLAALWAAKTWLLLEWTQTWAMALVLGPLVERVVVSYGGRHLFGNAPKPIAAVGAALRRPLVALTSALLIPMPLLLMLASKLEDTGWNAAGGSLAMFWVFPLAWTLYASLVLLLEGLPLRASAKRASVLIGHRYGRGIAFLLTGIAIRALAALTFELLAQFVISFLLQLGEPIDRLFEDGGSWPAVAGWLAACPYVALARLFDYVDARTRLEGWDIQVRFKANAAKAERERAR